MLGRQKHSNSAQPSSHRCLPLSCPEGELHGTSPGSHWMPGGKKDWVFNQTVLLYPKPSGFLSYQVGRMESRPVSLALRRPHSSWIYMRIFVLNNRAQKLEEWKAHGRMPLPGLPLWESYSSNISPLPGSTAQPPSNCQRESLRPGPAPLLRT